MDSSELDDLIDSSPFIDNSLRDRCKEYFRQVPKELSDWFYSTTISTDIYQGDVVDKLDVVYFQMENTAQQLKILDDIPCMLLSNTCDMALEGKSREKFISVVPIFDFAEFAENGKIHDYSDEGWEDFLRDISANRITDMLYIPPKDAWSASVVFLDKICSIAPNVLKARLDMNKSRTILSLSQLGAYYFLIKLTYHFARLEDRTEIIRD